MLAGNSWENWQHTGPWVYGPQTYEALCAMPLQLPDSNGLLEPTIAFRGQYVCGASPPPPSTTPRRASATLNNNTKKRTMSCTV